MMKMTFGGMVMAMVITDGDDDNEDNDDDDNLRELGAPNPGLSFP